MHYTQKHTYKGHTIEQELKETGAIYRAKNGVKISCGSLKSAQEHIDGVPSTYEEPAPTYSQSAIQQSHAKGRLQELEIRYKELSKLAYEYEIIAVCLLFSPIAIWMINSATYVGSLTLALMHIILWGLCIASFVKSINIKQLKYAVENVERSLRDGDQYVIVRDGKGLNRYYFSEKPETAFIKEIDLNNIDIQAFYVGQRNDYHIANSAKGLDAEVVQVEYEFKNGTKLMSKRGLK